MFFYTACMRAFILHEYSEYKINNNMTVYYEESHETIKTNKIHYLIINKYYHVAYIIIVQSLYYYNYYYNRYSFTCRVDYCRDTFKVAFNSEKL